MATQTAHFELEKPALTDVADIAVLNNNFDDIDVVMFANQERSVAAVSNQADAYDAAQTYAVGDLVIYENRLYKCTTAVTVAEPWDSTKWEQTTLADEIGSSSGGDIYSFIERMVGRFVDLKPVYEKTYQVTTPNVTTAQNLIDITDLNMDMLVAVDGRVKNITTDSVAGTTLCGDFILWVRFNYNNTGKDYIAIQNSYGGYKNQTMYVTVRYTKTTD